MLSYHHLHHAGNFADVLKHITLLAWLRASLEHPAPLHYLDTHAGNGCYDLRQARTQEYPSGAGRLIDVAEPPPEIAHYLHQIRATTPLYPGSPELARRVLRPQDQLRLYEYHPAAFAQLQTLMATDRRVRVKRTDGLSQLATLTPPKRASGLVLIDPPYERPSEYAATCAALIRGYQRWPSSGYLLWYPLVRDLPRGFTAQFKGQLGSALRVELRLRPENLPIGLNGCGLILVNAPASMIQTMPHWLAWLAPLLAQGAPPVWRIEPLD